MRAAIVRRWVTPHGMYGELSLYDELEEKPLVTYYTVERPYILNTPYISAIPCGEYTLLRGRYNKGGYEAFEIMGVPRRDDIKIHIANAPKEVVGCIGLGLDLSWVRGQYGVIRSREAFEDFMKRLEQVDKFQLTIKAEIPDYG